MYVVGQFVFVVQRVEIEEDGCIEQGFWFWGVDLFVELIFLFVQCQVLLWIVCYDVVFVQRKVVMVEIFVDVEGEG